MPTTTSPATALHLSSYQPFREGQTLVAWMGDGAQPLHWILVPLEDGQRNASDTQDLSPLGPHSTAQCIAKPKLWGGFDSAVGVVKEYYGCCIWEKCGYTGLLQISHWLFGATVAGDDAIVTYNPFQRSAPAKYEDGGKMRPPWVALAHEFYHVLDFYSGEDFTWVFERGNVVNGELVKNAWEASAVLGENHIRAENNLPLRVGY